MQKFAETIAFKRTNGSLAVMAGATATIYLTGTATLASLYEDDEVTSKLNPLISDANGLVQCKIPNGKYDIAYSNGGEVELIPGVSFSDGGGTYDPTNVSITGGTINGVAIGQTNPARGKFTNLRYSVDEDFEP